MRRFVPLLVLAALTAGCSKEDAEKKADQPADAPAATASAPAADGGPAIDACSLIDTAAVSEAVGVTVQEGGRQDSGIVAGGAYSGTCLWRIPATAEQTAAATAPAGPAYVILNAIRWPSGTEGPAGYLDAFRKSADHGVIPHQPVPLQIGEESLFWGDGVAVRKGSVAFGVSVRLAVKDAARQRAIEEVLAARIVGKL